MARWIAYKITAVHLDGMGRSLEKLGGLNAPHHPAAVMKAWKKWPEVPPDKMTVMAPPGKRLAAMARARHTNAAIRKAYAEQEGQ